MLLHFKKLQVADSKSRKNFLITLIKKLLSASQSCLVGFSNLSMGLLKVTTGNTVDLRTVKYMFL